MYMDYDICSRSFGHGTRKQTRRKGKDLQEDMREKQATCIMKASRKGLLVGARGQQEGCKKTGGGEWRRGPTDALYGIQ